ncbi:MAG: DNA mismatch repair protein MutH [Lactobacillales bacterium]|jgi:DNA mismatch repair protein MutH|nr:DNA mismatch repair protein MutH [Lactobacillales bacterium]
MDKFKSKAEVHQRALEAVDKTVKEINGGKTLAGGKHGVGAAWEAWFGKAPDNESAPDITEVGVELKATPIKKNKNGKYSAKERLVLNIINYMEIVNEKFESSHFLYKNGTLELAFYEWERCKTKDEYVIKNVALYEMMKNEVDFEIIKKDWEIIDDYVKQGKAHELSESLTTYLSPCTKGANSDTVRNQPFSDKKAKQRAYSLKSGYMTYLYNTYVLGDEPSESVIKDSKQLKTKSLEEFILEKINKFSGQSRDDLAKRFSIKNDTKATNPEIAKQIIKNILDVDNDLEVVQEFQKANIKPKTVVVEKGKTALKEEFKLFNYKFHETSRETWETSELREFLQDTKFLIIVFEKQGEEQYLKGAKFFCVPDEDIEGSVRAVWEDTVYKIKNGVEITYIETEKSRKRTTNFINSSKTNILFSKVSAAQTSYVEGPHSDELPSKIKWKNLPETVREEHSDTYMTKQAWWINKKYIYKQIKNLFI